MESLWVPAQVRYRLGPGTLTYGGIIAGANAFVKDGTGELVLQGANTNSTTAALNNGTLTLSGASGAMTSATFTVNQGCTLKLDNSTTNNNDRIAGTLTMNGGEFVVVGNAAANTTESLGALTLASGYSTVTMTPNAARNTQVTFSSLSRSAGALVLFRGINLGLNTVASQTAGASNIVFTAAPTLTGAGNSGTTTVGIISGGIGASGATGNTSLGHGFVTYNPPTGAVDGLRTLLAAEYSTAATPAANTNFKMTASRNANDTVTINSLLMSGGITYNFDNTGGANTMTITSGNILSVGGNNAISDVSGECQPDRFRCDRR